MPPEQLRGVDLHCHLDLYPDHQRAIARAEAAQVLTIAVTTTPRAWSGNQDRTADSRYVHAALGLHPQLVGEFAHELGLWERLLPDARYVGEVGLDASPRFYKSLDLQKQVFGRILESCADAGDKILSVHSLRSAPAVLNLIESLLPAELGTVVLHWFTGTLPDARRAVELGCYFSINAEMTRTVKGRALISALPADRLLTETDGPFTQLEDGTPAEPEHVTRTHAAIGQIRSIAEEEISRIVVSNLKAVLQPPSRRTIV